ncbi:43kDa postsynaptic protein [Parasponia andersonii]|uniref:RING-type E3 ubiquitin transferase n=1 Tax=Parasponia andersonii TaxID=3476 RepID=A0A2P5D0L7_PARAD|nr:43kDa postsynaptic protein [Parasponia andersonii]
MAIRASYECSMSLVDKENDDSTTSTPLVNPLSIYQAPLQQQERYFAFRIEFVHVLRSINNVENNIPFETYQEWLILPRRKYLANSSRITQEILRRIGVEPDFTGELALQISSFALATATEPGFAASRVLTLSLRVSAMIDLYDDAAVEKEEEEEYADQSLIIWTVPATKWSIEALKELNHSNGGDEIIISWDTTSEQQQQQCSVCMEKLWFEDQYCEDDRKVVQMPCSHVYHKDCVVQWLETSHLCPLCRYAMPTETD